MSSDPRYGSEGRRSEPRFERGYDRDYDHEYNRDNSRHTSRGSLFGREPVGREPVSYTHLTLPTKA